MKTQYTSMIDLRTSLREALSAFRERYPGQIDERRLVDIRELEHIANRSRTRAIFLTDVDDCLERMGQGLSVFGYRFFDNQRYDLKRYVSAALEDLRLSTLLAESQTQLSAARHRIGLLERSHSDQLRKIEAQYMQRLKKADEDLQDAQSMIDSLRESAAQLRTQLISPDRDPKGVSISMAELAYMRRERERITGETRASRHKLFK